MSIVFQEDKNMFILTTKNTKYMFKIAGGKYLVHCYYGYKSDSFDDSYHVQALSFGPDNRDSGIPRFSVNDAPLEFSYYGTGDYRCTSLRIQGKNGDSNTFYRYCDYEILSGRPAIPGMPSARTAEDTQTLAIHLIDDITQCHLTLFYTVYPSHDIITRYFILENKGETDVKIQKAMSICLDLPGYDYDAITLYGCQAAERTVQRHPIGHGNYSIQSRRGASSHNFNPFMALVSKETNEENGDVYAFNFVYSGSFLDEVEVDAQGNTRVGIGLGEENFAYTVERGEKFSSPEAIMLYTSQGLGDMSRKFHDFIRDTIVPEEICEKRPIVLNTWEAFYFDIDSELVLQLTDVAKSCGIDTIVVDDGWFGERNDDTAGLGDWYPNTKKFPEGLKAFADQVKQKGMKFGIWIEPEMVNPNSELYRAHPDWCLTCKERTATLSRNQLLLDLTNPEVLECLKKTFAEVFRDVPIDYIKWDFNRNATEAGSAYLSVDKQEEALYRYQLGVYDLYFWFREQFPNVFLENCSGGGGRYDLGMMALSHQIWASDNTDAPDRVRIQCGSTLPYPATVMSCHVSEPGYGSECMKNLEYKYRTAIGGILGYELNLLKASDEVKNEIRTQIQFYRKVENLIKNGYMYRLISPFDNKCEVSAYYYADKQQNAESILFSYLQNFAYQKRDVSWHMELTPQQVYRFRIEAADKDANYIDEITGDIYLGADLQAGIQIRMSKTEMYSSLMYLKKIDGSWERKRI